MRDGEFISEWEATRCCVFSITSTWFRFAWITLEEGRTFNQARWQEHIAHVSQEQAESFDMILVVGNHRIHFAQTSRDKVSQLAWSYPVTQFPSYSPDLQSFENLFAVIKKKVFKVPSPKGQKVLKRGWGKFYGIYCGTNLVI